MKTDIDRMLWYIRQVRAVLAVQRKGRREIRRMLRLAAYKRALYRRLESGRRAAV